ncbi:MAG: hypothetical protein LBR51_03910, partial [Bacteroidales bacterium]|nr:hypothetical protein [Bacteroidales bacterium]
LVIYEQRLIIRTSSWFFTVLRVFFVRLRVIKNSYTKVHEEPRSYTKLHEKSRISFSILHF